MSFMTWASFWPPFPRLRLDLLRCSAHMQRYRLRSLKRIT
jgi:hypothetical protein